jgi:hypothetical protein
LAPALRSAMKAASAGLDAIGRLDSIAGAD